MNLVASLGLLKLKILRYLADWLFSAEKLLTCL